MKLRGAELGHVIRRLSIASAAVVAPAPGVISARAVSLADPAITVADGNSVIAEQTGGNGLRSTRTSTAPTPGTASRSRQTQGRGGLGITLKTS